MKFSPFICPECNEPAAGTLEVVHGRAEFTEPEEDGSVEYTGETSIFWDEQRPVEREGKTVLLCSSGHEWLAEDLDNT